MVGINNLKILLKSMKPELDKRDFVFCSVPEDKLNTLKLNSLLTFREKEGVTIVLEKKDAKKNKLVYENVWSLITLTIHSDLNAIGLLAVISNKLAENNISLNAVSAYYHDHLFIPKNKAAESMKLLESFSE